MPKSDLTTLSDVKAWLAISGTNSDAVLSRLISACSRVIMANLSRYNLLGTDYVEVRNGTGTSGLILKEWPVNSVSLVQVGNTVIPPGIDVDSNRSAGYYIQPYDGFPPGSPQVVELLGYDYCFGVDNIKIGYNAGYTIPAEAFIVPASPFIYTTDQPYGAWAQDNGVAYVSSGTPLVLVAGTPTVGQYALVPNQPGQYQFAAADAGQALLVSYSYVPFDVAQACIEWVGERNSYRSRIGVRSKSLAAQESMSYDLSGIPSFVDAVLTPYRSVLQIL